MQILYSSLFVWVFVNPTMPGIYKMVKNTLTIMQEMLEHFCIVFDHFAETKSYTVN